MREPLTIEHDGLLLHGTSHTGPACGPVGVLFLNSGTLPRSSRGDLYVRLADSLAERGFPCFRVDLPGLGDSQGEAPPEYIDFYKLVQEGRYAPSVTAIARELRRRHKLAGLVLLGICGGAQTSIFAACRKDAEAGIAGLVLLDLLFFLFQDRGPGTAPPQTAPAKARARLRDWVLRQRWEPLATSVYRRLKRLSKRTRAGELPADTNRPLLDGLAGLLEGGLPALLITAHPPTQEPPAFDYIGYLAGRAGGRLTHVDIPGTTHSFVENEGPEAVLTAVSGWLERSAHA